MSASRPAGNSVGMTQIHPDTAWLAFSTRDRTLEGAFVGAVKSTGIYCKPGCPARMPKRENVTFYNTGAEARAAGYRACLRCRPDDVGRDARAVASAVALLEGDDPPRLEALAASVGYTPSHFQRLFVRAKGLSPARWLRRLKAQRAADLLGEGGRVTDAIYDAGYSAPSRFYDDMKESLAMTPSAWANGGAGAVIHWAVAETSLGPMLLAATAKGICRLSFNEGEEALQQRFPKARLVAGGGLLDQLLPAAVAACDDPASGVGLPLDVAGTAFQQAVWQALRAIPPGETRSYADIAAAVGKPAAVRAAGSANGANNVAVLIPCHRVIRSDGSLGGYAYGLEIKRRLLEREGVGGGLL